MGYAAPAPVMGPGVTIFLQDLAETRGFRVAALVEQTLDVYVSGAGNALAAQGSLVPVAVLLAGPGGISAQAPDGRPMSRAQIEALLPGVWARFKAGSGETASMGALPR